MPTTRTALSRALVLCLGLSALVTMGVPAHGAVELSINDLEPVAGDVLSIRARGCRPGGTVRVALGRTQIRSGVADANGNFSRGYAIPRGAGGARRDLTVRCLTVEDPVTTQTTTQSLKIRRALPRDEPSLAAGSRITLQASGCTPGALVRVFFEDERIASDNANPKGIFERSVRIPRGAERGMRWFQTRCPQIYPPGTERIQDRFVRVS